MFEHPDLFNILPSPCPGQAVNVDSKDFVLFRMGALSFIVVVCIFVCPPKQWLLNDGFQNTRMFPSSLKEIFYFWVKKFFFNLSTEAPVARAVIKYIL